MEDGIKKIPYFSMSRFPVGEKYKEIVYKFTVTSRTHTNQQKICFQSTLSKSNFTLMTKKSSGFGRENKMLTL